ncbi:MAG: PAS domain-containing protein [Proteobacteria bacterium]|nr:PAS domain-containing protein [Pseudomonadota bacterium]
MGKDQDQTNRKKTTLSPEKAIVVGIGGSAGSLDALEQFLSALPVDTGLILAVVLHSASERAEGLAEFLGRYSAMPALAVKPTARLSPDTVHVVRFDKNQNGTLHRIDQFFCRLAAEYGEKVIGIILSGGGADGAEGARAIAAGGGTVLIQNPADAPHPEMPQNALLACPTAETLTATQMAEKVLEIARVLQDELPNEELTEQLRKIFRIVKMRTGNDYSAYKPNTVLRRIDRRMKANGFNEVAPYVSFLEESQEEAHALSQDFCIGVTVFFRDPEAFDILSQQVIPRIFADKSLEETVRIWDTCCATGEETYSLAMLLHEYMEESGTDVTAKIFATDLDNRAITLARTGIYPESATLDMGENRLNTFFNKVDGGYQVVKLLREMIVFAEHNLIKDPPFSRLDLVVCRNFFIYLNTDIQRRLLTLFHSMLRPGGYLFMGNSESVGTLTELFTPLDKRWRIFKKRDTGRVVGERFAISRHVQMMARIANDTFRQELSEPDPGIIAEKILVKRYAPPCIVVNDKYEVVHVSTPTSHLLQIPTGAPTSDLFRMVQEELRPALRAAIHKALSKSEQVVFRGQSMTLDGQRVAVDVTAEPLIIRNASRKLALVTLQPIPVEKHPHLISGDKKPPLLSENRRDELICNLEEQLHISQEELNATIEQLAASNDSLVSTNEELMSVNEEFQSTNEELETSREELQTLNEELITLNTELQKKVEALDIANNDIENLLNGTQIATLFLDCNLKVKRYTPAASEIFNLIPSDINRPLEHITGKISHINISADARQVIDNDTPFDRSVRSIGGDRLYLMRILPYRTATGKVEGVVVTFVDLTDQQRMEESLREQAHILDLAPVMVRDLEGRIVLWNTGATRLYGFSKDEVEGRISHEVLATMFPEPLESIITSLYEKDSWDGELVHSSRDGKEISVMSQWVLYRDSEGKPSRIIEISADLTERKKIEEQYRLLFTEMTNGFSLNEVLFDSTGNLQDFRVVSVNPAFERITDLRADEVVGLNLFEVIPGMDESGGMICREVVLSGKPGHFTHKKIGSNKRFEVTLFRPAPGQLAMVLLDTSIQHQAESEREKLSQQLRQAQKMESLGVLAGGIAHDFNNLLTVIIGYSEFFLRDFPKGTLHARGFNNILVSAHRAKDLVNQILTFSRQSNADLMPLKIQSSVDEVLKMIRASIPTTIAIESDIEPQCGIILGNTTQVHQIIMNLCTNAYHAMENSGGILRVSVNMTSILPSTSPEHQTIPPGEYVKLTVSDTGSGIGPDIIDKIFDPYFTTKEVGKGSGMGLSIAHGIINSYGGGITVKSAVGQGSTFSVYFPVIEEKVLEPEEVKETRGGNERILLVDDEEMIVEMGQDVLGQLGYQVTTYQSSVEALSAFTAEPSQFDLVITDQAMPDLNGVNMAQQMLQIRPDLPIILCTGFSNLINESSAKAIGIREFAYKPLTSQSIVQLIRKVLEDEYKTPK